jgi:glycosyltransferase involved in cell wall biosynthesis
MISVIIPVYNVAEYLEKCLLSVCDQTYGEIEIILINDGSTDKSDIICKEWEKKDKRIRYFSRENQGQGEARNFGVSVAKGKYLTFLDSDDWWDNRFAELMLEMAEKWDADVTLCDINYVKGGEAECSAIRLPDDKPLYAGDDPDIINRTRTFLWGKLYRSDFYKGLEIKQASHIFEDTAVVPLIVAKAKRICRVAKPLHFYLRDRKGSMTNQFKDVLALIASLKTLKEGFEINGLFDHYNKALKKLAFSQVRFTIRKFNYLKKDNPHKLTEIKMKLFNYMDKEYPNWVNIDGKRVCVIGNYEQAEIIRLLLFDDDQLTVLPKMGIDFSRNRFDYVFTDLPTGLTIEERWNFADRIFYALQEKEVD